MGVEAGDMLPADIEMGKRVAAEYDNAAKETIGPGRKELPTRIGDHEPHLADVFRDLSQQEERQSSKR